MFKGLFKDNQKNAARTIVVVDDDAPIRDMLTMILEAEGYTLQRAATAEEGLQLLDRERLPDLLILDLAMPDMGGREFLAKARIRIGRTVLPPVLMLTASTDGEAVANELEVAGYLPKPFEAEQLLRHIQELL